MSKEQAAPRAAVLRRPLPAVDALFYMAISLVVIGACVGFTLR